MLEAAAKRWAADSSVTIVAHNLDHPLPKLGKFDAIVSCFAIHHLVHERKRALYGEIHGLLNPGGVFCNLEQVASLTPRLHEEFLRHIGYTVETEDPSNKLLTRKRSSAGCARPPQLRAKDRTLSLTLRAAITADGVVQLRFDCSYVRIRSWRLQRFFARISGRIGK